MHLRPVLTRAAVVMPGLVAAAVVAATPAAAAATAPPGYRIVRAADVPAPPSIFNATGQVSCPIGTVPLGGGASLSNGFADVGTSLNTSEPVPGGWRARVNNASGRAQVFNVDVICAKKPKGYKIVSVTGDNPPHASSAATATCPTGTVVLSGGALSTSDTSAVVLTSLGPRGSRKFTAVNVNTSDVDQRLAAFAVCAAKPPKYAIVSRSLTDIGPDDPVLTPVCPTGTSVLGGGIKVARPSFTIPIAGSLDEDRHGWFGEAVNQQPGTAMLTGQAICAA